jgi:hypothetical protein
VGCAGDRNVGEAGIDEFPVNVAVDVYENTVGRESLRVVAGDGIAVIEVQHQHRIERKGGPVTLPLAVQSANLAIQLAPYRINHPYDVRNRSPGR